MHFVITELIEKVGCLGNLTDEYTNSFICFILFSGVQMTTGVGILSPSV